MSVQMTESKVNNFTNITFFFGYACYIIMALLIPLVGSIMSSLNDLEIKRRNIREPSPYQNARAFACIQFNSGTYADTDSFEFGDYFVS